MKDESYPRALITDPLITVSLITDYGVPLCVSVSPEKL